MFIHFRCRRCRAPLSIEADQTGNPIHCPTCDCEMIVPAASEPDTPRGQMVQGVYGLLGEVHDPQESEPASGPASPAEGIGYGLQADPVLPQSSGGAILKSFPESDDLALKSRKKRRKRRGPNSPPRPTGRWSRRAPVLAGALVLGIIVTCSAKRVRSGPDADAPATPEAQVAIGEPISANLPVSWSTALKPVAPVFQKDQREGSQGAQKGDGEREAARGKPEDEKPLSASVPNARKTNGVNEPARALPPAPSAATAPDSSSSQMAIPVIKRRRNLSEEDLRKDIRLMPEIPSLNALAMNRLVSAQKVEVDFHQYIDHEPNILLKTRPDLKSLPVRKGRSCQLDRRSAANLGVFSQKLHALVDRPTPEESKGQHAMPALLQKFLQEEVRGKGPKWLRPEGIPALQQILMQENQPLRWLLVEILAKIPGPEASVALAQRALYDLSPEVRALAIQALKDRPRPDYRQVLLNGLRYPWAPIADHAAEALAALGDREVIPILVAYLSEPGPNEPVPSGKNQMVLREMARINHAANCLMCHPPAARLSDPLTAPVPGLFLLGSVPRTTGHYGSIQVNVPTRSGFFVRVDITYLRQDFSIREPIKTPGTDLVTYPRFDFLVRTRKVKSEEAKDLKAKSTSHHQQREAILFALRELTGVNAGSESNAWAKLYPPAKLDDETHGLRPKW